MASRRITLGIDVGPNSIGWVLVDTVAGKIVQSKDGRYACGVRIFPEGVDRDQQGGEKSKNQTRRVARGMRRQIQRRARRKRLLSEALATVGLLPTEPTARKALLSENPYPLRARVHSERMEPWEFGRVLFHLATHRGFLSNRKTDQNKETKGMKLEIGELQETLDQRGEVLGQYLAHLDHEFDHKTSPDSARVRHRHTERKMYEAEFDAIWASQQKHHPDLLTDELKYGVQGKQTFPVRAIGRRRGLHVVEQFGVHGLVFFQRPMYWPKWVVGQCDLTDEQDPSRRCKRKRCPRADRAAQRFRIYQEVNNLKVMDVEGMRPLDDRERKIVVDALLTTSKQTFAALRKKLGFTDDMTFNTERGGRDHLKGHETDAVMSSTKGVGKRWRTIDDAIKDKVVDICLTETQTDTAIKRLTQECGLTSDEAVRAAAVNLPDSRANFCRHAIERLNPHLERGLLLMGEDATNSALHAAGYLRPDQRAINEQDYLPAPPDLPNPIVRQALIEVRKVVNAVIREFGKPDQIHIELAREAKKSAEERSEIRFQNLIQERNRSTIAERLSEEFGIAPTRASINRYLLWQEQGGDCIYCGHTISEGKLFSGEVDIDHILPRWRSLDDSMSNKVVCHRRCNDEKRDRTAREWLEQDHPEKYERMVQLARKLDFRKREKLKQLDISLTDFVERQLRDTTYIARSVKEYLECLGKPVVCPRGGMTKDLRHWWGLNNILDPEQKGKKNRNDHRHHAIDALVIALMDHGRLFALANARGRDMPPPWPRFLDDARRAILGTNVSYRVQRKISGALHEATLYGRTFKRNGHQGERPWAKDWIEEPKVYVRRKEVAEIKTAKHLAKVRDKAIRDTLAEHLQGLGVDPYGSKAYPKDVFKGENRPRMKSGVPIKRVRMLEESETFRPLVVSDQAAGAHLAASDPRSGQFVKPGNNHHIVYWESIADPEAPWTAEVVPMWDAAQRVRTGLPAVDKTAPEGRRFKMSFTAGEMFEMVDSQGEIHLCVVRKLDQRSKRLFYKLHSDARDADAINKDNLYLSPKAMQERQARKVTVDPLGRIRWAND